MAKVTKSKLTPKQERFVREYLIDLNATQAAIRAGYSRKIKTAEVQGSVLLRNHKVLAAINKLKEIRAKKTDGLIATREERQIFWSQVMSNQDVDMKDRLKASELLGKSQADFIEKIQHSGSIDLIDAVVSARSKRGVDA